jgi:hypothetical protein
MAGKRQDVDPVPNHKSGVIRRDQQVLTRSQHRCISLPMDFARVLRDVVGGMEVAGIRYALIGGFAMALRGVQRATVDLDFILALEDMEQADALLTRCGYVRVFHSENVSHYESPDGTWGRIDILHAFRRPSMGMLARAELLDVEPGIKVRVAQGEDLIGLKKCELVRGPGPVAPAGQVREDAARPPPPRLLSPKEYVEFATFAARFYRGSKPVRFDGNHWKL